MRKFARNPPFVCLFVFVLLTVACLVSGSRIGMDTFLRMLIYNATDIDDYRLFPGRSISASSQPALFSSALRRADLLPAFAGAAVNWTDFLEETHTVAFLVVQNERIVYEGYSEGYGPQSLVQSFSMGKSIFALLIGAAVGDGYLALDTPVTALVPELARSGFSSVTVSDLLQMASGSNYRQSGWQEFNPFGLHPRFEYSRRLEEEILTLEVIDKPGSRFVYKSGDTALLGLMLSRALAPTGNTIASYMQARLWDPLGMESSGFYTTDHAGPDALEKTWCCLSATARDFARFGRLILGAGMWSGEQLVPADWIAAMRTPEQGKTGQLPPAYAGDGIAGYRLHWWLLDGPGESIAAGHLGQYLYIYPERELTIVRLGRAGDDMGAWVQIFRRIAVSLEDP